MNQNLSAEEAAFVAEFKSSHFAIMAELRQKVLDTLANPDAKMSEYNAALLMELRIERYIYQLSQRQERAERLREREAQRVRDKGTAPSRVSRPSQAPNDAPSTVTAAKPAEPEPQSHDPRPGVAVKPPTPASAALQSPAGQTPLTPSPAAASPSTDRSSRARSATE